MERERLIEWHYYYFIFFWSPAVIWRQ